MPRHLTTRLIVVLLTVAALAGVPALARRPAARPVVEVWPRWSGWRNAVEVGDEEFRIRVSPGPTRDRLSVDGRDYQLEGKLADIRRWDAQADPPETRQRLVWKERLGDRARWTVDGIAGPWARDLSAVVFDADGHTWHTATLDGRACVLRDGRTVARFDHLDHGSLPLPRYFGHDHEGRWLVTPEGCFGPFRCIRGYTDAPDRRHWACYVQRGGQWAVLHDGRQRGWYDEVGYAGYTADPKRWGGPQFGPDNCQLSWASRQGRQWRVWLNDKSWPLGPGEAPCGTEAVDEQTLLWCLQRRQPGGWRWFENGRAIGVFHGRIFVGFSGTKSGHGWTLETEPATGGKTTIRCHLGRFGPFELGLCPLLSDGGRVAWIAVGDDGGKRLWLDGHPMPGPVADQYDWHGETLIGTQYQPGRSLTHVNGLLSPSLDGDLARLVERGGHVAYLARDGRQQVLVIDQQVRLRAPELTGLTPLDNGRRWRVTTSRPARWAWLDRWQGGPPSPPLYIATTPDGEHRATVETRPGLRGALRWYLHHDGRLMTLPGPVAWLLISPDGRHTVCQTRELQPCLLADGRRVLRAEASGATFLPDGVFLAKALLGPEPQVVSLRWPATR